MNSVYKNIFILILSFVCIASTVHAANNCSAKAFIGSSCNTDCQAGWHGVCSGGFFTADCTCERDPGTNLHPFPPIIPKQLQDCQEFESWALANPSPAIQQLSGLATNSRTALLAQNINAFSVAEDQFWQAWQSCSMPDQAQLTAWRTQHGYFN